MSFIVHVTGCHICRYLLGSYAFELATSKKVETIKIDPVRKHSVHLCSEFMPLPRWLRSSVSGMELPKKLVSLVHSTVVVGQYEPVKKVDRKLGTLERTVKRRS